MKSLLPLLVILLLAAPTLCDGGQGGSGAPLNIEVHYDSWWDATFQTLGFITPEDHGIFIAEHIKFTKFDGMVDMDIDNPKTSFSNTEPVYIAVVDASDGRSVQNKLYKDGELYYDWEVWYPESWWDFWYQWISYDALSAGNYEMAYYANGVLKWSKTFVVVAPPSPTPTPTPTPTLPTQEICYRNVIIYYNGDESTTSDVWAYGVESSSAVSRAGFGSVESAKGYVDAMIDYYGYTYTQCSDPLPTPTAPAPTPTVPTPTPTPTAPAPRIDNDTATLTYDKSSYKPGDTVTLTATGTNVGSGTWNGRVTFTITQPDGESHTTLEVPDVAVAESTTESVSSSFILPTTGAEGEWTAQSKWITDDGVVDAMSSTLALGAEEEDGEDYSIWIIGGIAIFLLLIYFAFRKKPGGT